MTSNPGIISQMASSPTAQLKDGVDNIHTGIIKALHIASGESRAISGFDLTQTNNGGTTRFGVGSGKVLRNGKMINVSAANLDTTASTIGANSSDWYGVIVVCDGTESGESANTLKWRFGAVTGKANTSAASVAELKDGDIPVIVVKIDTAEANSATSRLHQFLGFTQASREFSAIDSGNERLRINKGGTLTYIPSSTEYTLTLPSTTGTIALTSDIANMGTGSFADLSVTTAKLANDAVSTIKIDDDAVTYVKMQDISTANRVLGVASVAGQVTETQIKTAMIEDDAVTTAKIYDNAITSAKIANGTIVEADIANDAVTLGKIQNIANNTVLGNVSGGSANAIELSATQLRTLINVESNADVTDTTNVKAALHNVNLGSFTLGDSNDNITVGNLTIGGNLTVSGTTTTVNTATLDVADNNITLNSDYSGNSPTESAGITVNRGGGTQPNKTLLWDENNDRWSVGSETFVAGSFIGDVTGTVSSANTLTTARNFSLTGDVTAASVSFNGSGNVVLSSSLAANTVNTDELVNNAVTNAKVADNAIDTAELAAGAVTTAKIADDAITSAKIADDAITSALIADDAIISALIADDAIVTASIADNAVTNDHLAGSIAQTKITNLVSDLAGKQATLTFGAGLSNSGATINVDIDELDTENAMHVTNDFIMYDDADNGLRKINLANVFSKITESDLPNLSASKIASGTFSASRIPSLDTSKIGSGTFGTSRIADDAVTFAKVQNVGSGLLLGRSSSGAGEIETLSASAVRTLLNVDTSGTDNSTDVTLAGSRNYLTLNNQTITLGEIDISDDTNLVAGTNITLSGDTLNVDTDLANYSNTNSGFLTAHPTISGAASSSDNNGRTYIQDITLDSNGHVIGIATATETVTDTQYSVGDGGLTQNNFTNALKTKLDNIETNANNFILQTASASTLGGVKIGSNLTINSGTGVLSADTQSDVNFTSALNTKLAGIDAGATAGANFATNVSNISVTNAQLAGSIANNKLTNSSVTVNGSTVALGGSITLTTANVAEGANLYFTEERVDDRVNALLTDGEGITTTYNDGAGTLTIEVEDATASNKGIASFASADFDISSGAVSVKSAGISNTQLAGSITNDKLLDIAQNKVTGLTSALNSKIENLGDLSITASAAEINILDGVTGVSATEIGHLDGVTSAIQTQLDGKQASGNYLTTSSTITSLSGISEFDTDITAVSNTHNSVPSAKAVKEYVDMVSFDANDTQYTFSVEDTLVNNTKRLKLTGTDGSFTSVNFEGSGSITVSRVNERIIIDSDTEPVESVSYSGNTLTLTKTDLSTITATIPDATTNAHGLMTDDQFDKLAGVEAGATADQTAAEIRTLVESASDSNVFTDADHSKLNAIEANATADQTASEIRTLVESATDSNVFTDADHTKLNGIAASANNYSISSDLLDEDDMSSNSATKVASQQSIKAYVDTEVAAVVASAPAALDTLNELAAALGDDANFATTTSTSLGNRLRVDTNSQGLSATQQGNAITNLGITASLAEINILDGGLSASDIPNLNASKINAGTFATARIADSAVTTAKIADDAVTVAKINGLTNLGSGVVISSAERTKLSGIETSADVTDATNVAAAGAVMDGDFTSNGFMKRTGAGTYTVDTNTYLTAHPSISAASSSDNSGRTYIQDITLDSNGHVTGIATATETVVNTDTQLTQEQVEDFVNGVIVAGTNMTKTYDDTAGTLTLSSTGKTQEEIEDIVANLVVAGTNVTKTYDDAAGTLTLTSTDTNTQLSTEQVQDIIGAMVSGNNESNITVTYDDTNGKLDFNSTNTNTQLSNEEVEDVIGGMVTGNTETFISVSYEDSDGTLDFVVPVLDEDDMNTNSATHLATQQSIKAYVDTEVAGLVDSAPGALNTLNELAAAINDDATFSATVTTALGNRLRVDTASQGLSGTEQSNARTNLNVDVAGTDNSVPVTLANTNYLSLSGQQITGGTIPISSGGTGATSAAAARTALGVDAAGTQVSTDVTLVTSSHDYLSISGQAITLGQIDISDDTNLTAGTGLTLSGDTLNVNAAQSGITSVGTLSSLTVSGDVTVDTNTFKIDSTNNRVGIGTASPGYKLQVEGSFAAQTKSFVIPHPTQEGKTLQHGSLEGPEHGVYHRGRLEGSVIQLPEYWTGLVDEDTISVQLTANGDFQMLYVEKIEDNQVFVANAADEGIDCFYLIHGERKDVGRMEVEY